MGNIVTIFLASIIIILWCTGLRDQVSSHFINIPPMSIPLCLILTSLEGGGGWRGMGSWGGGICRRSSVSPPGFRASGLRDPAWRGKEATWLRMPLVIGGTAPLYDILAGEASFPRRKTAPRRLPAFSPVPAASGPPTAQPPASLPAAVPPCPPPSRRRRRLSQTQTEHPHTEIVHLRLA